MSENRLAHCIWQCAKMLVALLEKEFGLGKPKLVEPGPVQNMTDTRKFTAPVKEC